MSDPKEHLASGQPAREGLTLNPDRPVRNLGEDRLDVYPFVRRLARPLLEAPADSSLVLGLYGPWGYGKTSALNLLERALTDVAGTRAIPGGQVAPGPVVVRFTPWLYSSVETLLAAFFETLGSIIGGQAAEEGQRDRWKRALRGMGEFVSPAVKLGTMLLPLPGGAVTGKVVEAIGGAITGVAKGAAAQLEGGEATFRQRKDEASQVLTELSQQEPPQRVVVMIDDLDRAGPEEVLAMLKLVKLAADLPNVSYVLAMDRARVADLLAATVAPAYGNDFLDKIVQIGVTLPPVGPDRLSRAAVEDVTEIAHRAGMDTNALVVDWSGWEFGRSGSYERHLRKVLRTPRDVVRLLNAFSFAVLSSESRADVHPVDLLLVCLLQVRFPTVYEAIQANRRFLLAEEIDISLILNREREAQERAKAERHARLVQIASEPGERENAAQIEMELASAGGSEPRSRRGRQSSALEILLQLFPHAVDGGATVEEQRTARREGRIRSPERFEGYFRLDPAAGQVTLAEVEALFGTITTAEKLTEDIPRLRTRLEATSELEMESLTQGLLDRAAGMNRGEAAALCVTLPNLARAANAGGAVLPPSLIAELARRAVVRLRTGIYGEETPNREQERELALDLLMQLTRAFDAEEGATFAEKMSERQQHELDLSDEDRHALAMVGLERSMEELARAGSAYHSTSSKALRDMIWRCRHLAANAGVAEPAAPYSPLKAVIDQILANTPESLSDVLALGAAWSGPDLGTPTFMDRSLSEVRQNLALMTDIEHLETLAADAVTSGAVEAMRWPELVETFARWAAAEPKPGQVRAAHDDTAGGGGDTE